MIDTKELRMLAQEFKLAGSPMFLQTTQMNELLDRIEAAEKERDQLAAETTALRAEVDALRLNDASVQPELVAVALAACDAVDDLIEKWYATRESGCLPNQVVRARGASKLLRAIALEAKP